MSRTYFLAVLILGLCMLHPPVASGQSEPPRLDGWFDLNTYDAASTPLDGLILENARVLDSIQMAAGAYAQFDNDPLTWQEKNSDDVYKEEAVVVDRLIAFHVTAAMGFFGFSQIAVRFPFYLDEGRPGTSGDAGDLCAIPKLAYRIKGDKTDVGLAVVVPLSFPTGNEENFVGQGGFSAAPGIAADFGLGIVRIVFNSAFSWRRKQTEFALVRGSEVVLGLGTQVTLIEKSGNLRAIIEARAATQTEDFFGRAATPVDLIGGFNYRFENGITLMAGIGTALSAGVGAPDLRGVAGIGFVPGFVDKGQTRSAEEAQVEDSDRDGIADNVDQCPTVPEDFDFFKDSDGCLDADNDADGIPDSKDNCPMEPESANGIDDQDGCVEIDEDQDLIPDTRDECPKAKEDLDGFEDGDGCPDEDNDLDRIVDGQDRCPFLPESDNNYKDDDGCPDYFELVGNEIKFKRRIPFKPKTAELVEPGHDILEELGMAIMTNPSWKEINLTVHTSGEGNRDVQQALSEERAMTIMRFWVTMGVLPERLIAVGKGNSEPLESPSTPQGRIRNERIEIRIVMEPPK